MMGHQRQIRQGRNEEEAGQNEEETNANVANGSQGVIEARASEDIQGIEMKENYVKCRKETQRSERGKLGTRGICFHSAPSAIIRRLATHPSQPTGPIGVISHQRQRND